MDTKHASIKMFDLNRKFFDNAFMAASNAQDQFEKMMVSCMALSPWFPEETRTWITEGFDTGRNWRNQVKAAVDGHFQNMKVDFCGNGGDIQWRVAGDLVDGRVIWPQVDHDRGHAAQLLDLLRHRGDAVPARHPRH